MKFLFILLFLLNAMSVIGQEQMPDIQMNPLIDKSTVHVPYTAVSGKVIAPKGRAITALTINDEEYPVSVSEEAGFYRKIKLVEGENTIKIKAEDTEGALAEKVMSVFFNTQKDEKAPENIVSPVNKDEETKSENPYILSLAASIIKISGKKVEFCAGKSDGIQVNGVLKIKRGKSVIGKIKVLSVSDSKSTGEIIELNKNIKIHKADSVFTLICFAEYPAACSGDKAQSK